MKPKIVTIKLCLLLLVFLSGCNDNTPAQKSTKVVHKKRIPFKGEADFQKDTLYILWEKQKIYHERGWGSFDAPLKYHYGKPFYSEEEKGLIFEFTKCNFIYEDGAVSDTLKIKNISAYPLNRISEIDAIDSLWKKKNEWPIKRTMGAYTYYYMAGYNRNTMYVTYLIKVTDNKKKFIVYPVHWYYPPEVVQ